MGGKDFGFFASAAPDPANSTALKNRPLVSAYFVTMQGTLLYTIVFLPGFQIGRIIPLRK